MEKKLTINDIAVMAGVAKSTVSRYLNGGSVKETTAAKIRKVIEQENYEPNVFARLSAKSSRIIGLIVPRFNSYMTPYLVEYVVAYLKEQSYTPLILHTGNDPQEEIRCLERLTNMNVDGIMIIATGVSKKHEEAAAKVQVPVLFLGQRFPRGISVINDDYHAGEELGSYLGQCGVRTPLLLWVGADDPAVGIQRRQGIEDGLKKYGIEHVQYVETTFFQGDAECCAREILSREEIPDAIICATDRLAQGVYKEARSQGIRIPEDISVTGFGDYPTSELLMPPLTTIHFDLEYWGQLSAETMLQMVERKPVGKLQMNTHQLIRRDSVKERTKKK